MAINLEAPTYDITVQQGKTVELSFQALTQGLPLDLSGWDLRAQVRATFESPAVINCTLQNGRIAWVDAGQGRYTLTLDPADTAGISGRSFQDDTFEGVYDIELISPSTKVLPGPKGAFVVKREVTR